MESSRRWQPMSTMNMNSMRPPYYRAPLQSANPTAAYGHERNGRRAAFAPYPTDRLGRKRADEGCFHLLYSYTSRMFSSYPILLQAVMTAIIGFVAYFFYDYAVGLESWRSYLLYKLISFFGFVISVTFLYLFYTNLTSASSPSATPRLAAPPSTALPPFANKSKLAYSEKAALGNLNNVHMNHKPAKRDDLFFTQQSMNRVSSSTFHVDTKYDFDSSPTKIASYDPNQIVNQQKLDTIFDERQAVQHRGATRGSFKHATPSSTAITSSMANVKTPIGKTFGSMRMTPAVPTTKSHLLSTPLHQSHQGSAHIYTPGSSNMDVTMKSLGKENEDPFLNLDYSAIHPAPSQSASARAQKSVAWNVSGFGAGAAGLGDVSTIAQPGTPARAAYDYDGMYSDINLRGDNIGNVLPQDQQHNKLQSHAGTILNNAGPTAAIQRHHKVVQVSRKPPVSPFSRQRERNERQQQQLLAENTMNPVVFSSIGLKKSQFAAHYMEKSVHLYKELKIGELMANWAENTRWWMAEMMRARFKEFSCNNANIDGIFQLLQQKYNLGSQLSAFQTPQQKESFVVANEQQLFNVARAENNQFINNVVQKTKHLKECMDFMVEPFKGFNDDLSVTQYVSKRIQQLSCGSHLMYNWNKGEEKTWQHFMYPSDAQIFMSLFCKYMDDAMCPAIKFSEKHYIEISVNEMDKIEKLLYKQFKDIAIICVSEIKRSSQRMRSKLNRDEEANANRQHLKPHGYNLMEKEQNQTDSYSDITAQDSLPYYFIAYNKQKFDKVIKQRFYDTLIPKPKHSLWNTGIPSMINDSLHGLGNYFNGASHRNASTKPEEKTDLSEDDDDDEYFHHGAMHSKRRRNGYYGGKNKKRSKHGDENENVGTWYPQPGKNNLFHAVTLFALFLHKCCNDKLADIALKDQGCTLLHNIFK